MDGFLFSPFNTTKERAVVDGPVKKLVAQL